MAIAGGHADVCFAPRPQMVSALHYGTQWSPPHVRRCIPHQPWLRSALRRREHLRRAEVFAGENGQHSTVASATHTSASYPLLGEQDPHTRAPYLEETTSSTRSTTNDDDDGQPTNQHDGHVGDDSGRASPVGRAVRADPATGSQALPRPRALRSARPVPFGAPERRAVISNWPR